MKTSKPVLFCVAVVCLTLLGVALYLQIVERMQPCPLCIIQRYAFAAIALICLVFTVLPRGTTATGAGFGMLASLAGAGTAGWHLWVKAHPEVSCGIDPLETSLNTFGPANWLPLVFKADGFCTTPYAPILGLSIPQWSLVWFLLLALVLGWVAFKRRR
ncbi:disulfide bond formation protein B [Actimicrobium antarcticum]|uniref:Disulfide bond formation protein B n=1 Tax=Actimicrobium antarcticum TaxID=1051899 RepID=A0ABP7TVG4_9BURK